ncbi:MAG TPA: hypothetical protein DIW81_02140 [Planctomycetaceae bacterium]|nr:hypothetical protein [Rubinisphaera sp.]HCS50385.1 hypothetical protein [Planctomycetaceae bacterium]
MPSEEVFGIETLLLGWGLNSDNLHSPNEHFHLTNFHRGRWRVLSCGRVRELGLRPVFPCWILIRRSTGLEIEVNFAIQ